MPRWRLPLYGVGEEGAVGGVGRGEGVAAVLHAEHHEGFGAIVAHAALALRRYADHSAFTDGKDITVDLELAFASEEKVEFFVVLMGVQEACLLARGEDLEREFAACGAYGLSAEHFAGDFDVRTELEYIILDVGEGAEVCRAEIRAFFNCLNLFHIVYVFC